MRSPAVRVRKFGWKRIGFDAAGHEIAGTSGGAFEERAEGRVGCEEHLRDGVEARGEGHGHRLQFFAQ